MAYHKNSVPSIQQFLMAKKSAEMSIIISPPQSIHSIFSSVGTSETSSMHATPHGSVNSRYQESISGSIGSMERYDYGNSSLHSNLSPAVSATSSQATSEENHLMVSGPPGRPKPNPGWVPAHKILSRCPSTIDAKYSLQPVLGPRPPMRSPYIRHSPPVSYDIEMDTGLSLNEAEYTPMKGRLRRMKKSVNLLDESPMSQYTRPTTANSEHTTAELNTGHQHPEQDSNFSSAGTVFDTEYDESAVISLDKDGPTTAYAWHASYPLRSGETWTTAEEEASKRLAMTEKELYGASSSHKGLRSRYSTMSFGGASIRRLMKKGNDSVRSRVVKGRQSLMKLFEGVE